MFAKQVLDYPDGQELPPKQESDVAQYAAIFRNCGTAANYLGTLKWYCLMQSLDVSWATPRLKVQLKGLKKMSMASMAGKLVTELALLTREVLFKVAAVTRVSAWLSSWCYTSSAGCFFRGCNRRSSRWRRAVMKTSLATCLCTDTRL